MITKTISNQKDGNTNQATSILPFVQEDAEASKLAKDNLVTLELKVNPADADSAKVKTNVRKASGTESPREIIHWVKDLFDQVFPGMGLTTGAGQRAVLKTVTMGNAHLIVTRITDAKATAERLRRAIADNADPTNAGHMAIMGMALDDALNLTPHIIGLTLFEIIESMVPRHALVKVQRYLRREHCKSGDM